MKLRNIIRQAKSLPKKAKTSLLVLLALALPVTGIVQAQSSQAIMEGWTKSLNVTKGETEYKDSTNAMVDEVVQVQLWYHNRQAVDGPVAENTRVKFDVPNTQGKVQTITGTTTADNANTVTDNTTVNLSLDRARIEYIEGTAKWRYNKGAFDGDASCQTGMDFPPERCYATVPISDDVVNNPTGVNLGESPGCNAYHATVTIQVRVIVDAVSVQKFVRHAGQTSADWKASTNAKPGDDLEYLIEFKNEGNTRLNNVVVGDNLPKYNVYVNGSTNLRNGANPNGIKITSDNITKGGIDVGHYMPGAVGYVWFKVKIDPVTAFEKCGQYDVRNVAVVRPEGMNEFYNTAQVLINVECEDEPEEPVYRCDLIKAELVSGRKYKFTVNATALNGATIKQYRFNFGDNTAEVVTDKNVVEHTFPEEGTFVIKSTVDFNVDGQVKSHTAKTCETIINTKKPPVTPPVTPPTQLPVTGAGDVIGMFVATTVAAGLAHKFVWARRYL